MLARRLALKVLFPVASAFCDVLHLRREPMEGWFVDLNNRLVLGRLKVTPERILLLMPHCLQFSECTHRITGREIHCTRCGRCAVADLLGLAEKYGVKLSVATGGNMARTIVRSFKPDMIIATACERDLIAGLKDTVGVPAVGVLNERPNGPCFDTNVDIGRIARMLETLLARRT